MVDGEGLRHQVPAPSSGTTIPKVDRAKGADACCDVVNRGVAAWNGKIYLGALDGRLIALNGKTGSGRLGKADHRHDAALHDHRRAAHREGQGHHRKRRRGISRARLRHCLRRRNRQAGLALVDGPRRPVERLRAARTRRSRQDLEGRVVEARRRRHRLGRHGLRSRTRHALRRHRQRHAVEPDYSAAPAAATTSTCLRSSRSIRSTGKYKWHYQTTPGETWDYTATQPIMVADLNYPEGKRRVVMQAPKNGFFYVLDAKTGKLLNANKFAPLTWASHVDMKTGRPVEYPEARYRSDRQARDRRARCPRHAQLASDGVQPGDGLGLPACYGVQLRLCDAQGFQAEHAGLEHRHRLHAPAQA